VRLTIRKISTWTWARSFRACRPKRPQDRIELPNLKREFISTFTKPVAENGFGKSREDLAHSFEISAQNGASPVAEVRSRFQELTPPLAIPIL
jgi:hypothetical protein